MSSTEKPDTTYNLDPICIFHNLRQSEHVCLVCCLCFSDMTIEEAGETGEDVCISCKKLEADRSAGIDQ